MAVVKCQAGHFYDGEKYAECPHCGNDSLNMPPVNEEIIVQAIAEEVMANSVFHKSARSGDGEEKTVGLFVKRRGLDPVVGWLVCVGGDERGRDYRLHAGRNFVGRSHGMDVSIPDDDQITRENHCSIVYEPVKGNYLLVPGSGTNTYFGETQITGAQPLREGDRFRIGATELEFIPYCREGRTWD